MAHMITLNDGSMETIFDERDFLNMVDERLGMEARRWLEDYLSEGNEDAAYIDDLEIILDSAKAHHKEVMGELRKLSEEIAGIICQKDIDRRALSNAAGQIGIITWREINAR